MTEINVYEAYRHFLMGNMIFIGKKPETAIGYITDNKRHAVRVHQFHYAYAKNLEKYGSENTLFYREG